MRIGTAVAAALLVTGVTTGTASAAPVNPQTGTLTYTCTYPGLAPQASTFTGSFTAEDTVPPGGTFTLTGVFLSHVMSPALRSLFTAAGYDAVQGSFGATITATNATPATAIISGGFPEQPVPTTGGLTFPESAGDLTFTAGAAGSIGFALGVQVSETLQFHQKRSGTWVAWSSNCTLKATSPAQNRAFQPDIAIF
ncbi:DUF6801 domain-containing protein [Amycolatopsis vancoresmycina]|uniref:DUF6801 domain-containing protein n=1 Tax=Amycolatopsis vancoresmycina DSM 44592 TaxID=1292037 RepID=R1I1X2_9PSEU|nr:DUF6801 domain-containing protein [Amycolatopsis vancoresmycina]EOD66511.1 hypothetical protein H480_20957 [Amycolatopsis vancoresmycina DSM 44592]